MPKRINDDDIGPNRFTPDEQAQVDDLLSSPRAPYRRQPLDFRWSFSFEKRGDQHTEVTVRVGTPGSRALAGRLVLRNDEAGPLLASLDRPAVSVVFIEVDGERPVSDPRQMWLGPEYKEVKE